jgi:DNA replication protein DnaC
VKPNVTRHQGARRLPYTHVATGLALAACRQGKRVRFYNAAGLVNELIKAQQEYRLSRLMTQLGKYELIVLDELGFIPFTATGAQLLFQFCSALYERVAIIVTTNLRFAEWRLSPTLSVPACYLIIM